MTRTLYIGAMFAALTELAGAQTPFVDPLSVTRTLIAKEDEAAAKKKAQQEGMRLIPASEFDEKLARARGQLLGVKATARLIESRYEVEFTGHALSMGTASWRVQAPADSPGLLRCPQWNLAASDPYWEDDAEATVLFGMLDGADTGLWTDAAGERHLRFNWSARGAATPQGTQFELRVPPAPIMLLEIRMSAEYQLVLGKNVGMVTGPHAGGAAGLMTWRIRATGRSQFDFSIRKISNESAPATILASVDSRQTLTPDRLQADFDFSLDVLHHPVRDLTFSLTRGLKVYEVSCRQTEIKSWSVKDSGDGPGQLALTLAEPMQGAALALRIRAFLPSTTAAGDQWTCPEVRLLRATQRNETVRLVIAADNPLQFWEPGDFRLIDTLDDQGTQTLTLVDAVPQGESKRPRFFAKTPGIDLTTTQKTRWIVAPTDTTVVTDISYDLARGQLLQLKLALRTPKVGNWQVAGVKLMPGDVPLTWGIVESWLVVDLRKAINPRSDATLQVVLKGEWNLGDETPRVVDFPELEPLDTLARQGTVAIEVSPLFQASLVAGSMAGFQLDPGKDERATFYFGYRNQRSAGQLRLIGLPAQYAARVQQTAILRAEECAVNAEITVEPLIGQPTFVDIWVQGRAAVHLKTSDGKESVVRSLQRLPQPDVYQAVATLSGGANAFGMAGINTLVPRGQHWRLTFREPLKKPVSFELQCIRRVPLALGPWLLCMQPATHPFTLTSSLVQIDSTENQNWIVPLLGFPRAERFAGEILLQPEEVSIKDVRGSGIDIPENSVPGPSASSVLTSRSFRYGSWSLVDYPRLWVTTQAKKSSMQESAAIDHARLDTFVGDDGEVHHHLSWTLWNWRSREFLVQLNGPPQRILGVRLNGRALDHWKLDEHRAGQSLIIPLMIETPRDLPIQRLEIFYAPAEKLRPSPLGWPVSALMPVFPIPPIQTRHVWHLAPKMLPLHQEQMQSLSHEMPGAWLGRTVWQTGSGLTDFFIGEREQPWRTRQSELLKYAEREVRRSSVDRPWLGHWVQSLAFEPSLERTSVVLDREELRRRGCTPQRAFDFDPTRPFWESLNLTYVPCPDAILLTSPRRAAQADDDPAFRRSLYEAVRDAARAGQDRSGTFVAADYWLRSESIDADALDHLPPFLKQAADQGWTQWEWLPGHSIGALSVVQQASVRWLGVMATVFLLLFGSRLLYTSPRLTIRLTLFLILLGWLACNHAPASLRELFLWPLLGMLLLLVNCYRTMHTGSAPSAPADPRPGQSTHKAHKAALASVLFLLAAAWALPSMGQAPASTEIRIFAAQDNSPELALVSPEFDAQLQTLLGKTPAGFQNAVYLRARYKGTWHGTYARVRADYDVYCFQETTKLLIPLADAELESGMTVDGVKVYPVLAPGAKPAGYVVGVQGIGVHRLKLSFLLQPQASGEFSELQCGIPPALDARLDGQFPLNWLNPQVAGLGSEAYQKGEKGGLWDVQADIGPESTFKLRWRSDAPTGKAQTEVHEAYLADLRPGSATLTAWLQYKAIKGVVERVQIALDDLEVRKVEWSVDGKSLAPLSSWNVVPRGESKLLQIDLPEPTSGSFQVLLDMTPRLSVPGKLEVRLPMPLASLRGSHFAYRGEGLEVAVTPVQLADTRVKVEEFAKWPRKLEGTPAVYSFGRKAPQAGLRFDIQTPVPQVTLSSLWTLQPPYVDVRADMTWSSTEPLSLVQLEVPATITLTDVQGQKPQDVHHWSRTKNILQIWLQKPTKQVTLSAIGSMKLPMLKENRFLLPPLVPLQGRILSTTVIAQTTTQYQFLPLTRKDKAVRVSEDTPAQRTFELTTPRIPVEVGFERRATAPSWQAQTLVAVHDDIASWQTSLTAHHPFGQFAGIKLVLRDWPFRIQPRFGEPLGVRGYQRKGDDHFWILDARPGAGPSQVTLKLQGRWPRRIAPTLNVPTLEILGADKHTQTLMLEGCELTPASKAFVANANPGVADGIDLVTLIDPHARIAVSPVSRPRHVPIEALYAEHTTFLSMPDQWHQRMEWLLHTKGNPELSVQMPRGSQLVRLSVNDQPATPVLASEERLNVPLPAASLCQVRIEWRDASETKTLTKPRLESPTLEGVEVSRIHYVFLLPNGLATDATGESEPCDWLLSQAQAYLAADVVPSPRYKRLGERIARHARYRAILAGKRSEEIDKLIAEYKIVAAPLAMDVPASLSELAAVKVPVPAIHDVHAGTLLLWSRGPKEAAPTLELREVQHTLPFVPRGPREVVTLFLLALLLVAFLPGGLGWLTALWPEQLAFAVLVGVAMGGFSPLAAAVLVIALLGRLILFIRWSHRTLARWWQRKEDDNALSSVHFQGPT